MTIGWLQLELLRPGWLVLLVVLPIVIYAARRGITGMTAPQRRLTSGLRIAVVVFLVLAQSGVTWLRRSDEQFVVFIHDATASVDPAERQAAEQFIEDALSRRGAHQWDVVTIDSASPGTPVNIAREIQAAAASIPADYVGKVVLLSDGRAPSDALLAAAAGVGMPVSAVPLESFSAPEVLVSHLRGPSRARPRKAVSLEIVVRSNRRQVGAIQWTRDGENLARENVQLVVGENRFRTTLRVGEAGHSVFAAKIEDVDDTRPGNNLARAVVMIAPEPRVLLVESEPELAGPLAGVLAGEQFDVQQRLPRQMNAGLEKLSGYDLLILANVAADSLDKKQLAAIDAYVREQGGGLIVIGGRAAFDPKTFANSALERLLPVAAHVAAPEKQPSMAMVLAIDKSNSMRGPRDNPRIDLAKVAAKQVVQGLSPRDKIGVVAFGDDAEWVSQLRPLADKQAVLDRIDRLRPSGLTNMYPALEKAYLALRETEADRKHVILLTDGLSAPGDFDAVAKAMANEGITVWTIAVGVDAEQVVLRDIAKATGGQHFRCENAQQLPKIFADVVERATKSVLKEGVFLPHVISPSPKLVSAAMLSAPPLAGYVQTSPKSTAELVLATDSGDPLLAWWRYGRGVTMAFTSGAKGRWAGQWLDWPGYGDFWRRAARHAMRDPAPSDFTLRVEPAVGQSRVTLDGVHDLGGFRNGLECVLQVTRPDGSSQRLSMRQVAPGRYEVLADTPVTGIYMLETSATHNGDEVHHDRRGVSVDYSRELRSAPADRALLQAVAELSGGVYDPQPADIFAPTDRAVLRPLRLWSYLLIVAAVLFVLDVVLRRVALSRD